VAAPADAERLELAEGVVEDREAAREALGEHLLAGDDAVALEQQLGQRATPLTGLRLAAEERGGQRPAPLHLRRRAAAARGEALAGPAAVVPGALGAGQREARRAQRCPRVVGHLAGPHEVPQRLLDLPGRDAQLSQEIGEEAGRPRQPLADKVVLRRVRTLGLVRRWADGLHVVAEVERDAARVAAERARADPDELAACAEL